MVHQYKTLLLAVGLISFTGILRADDAAAPAAAASGQPAAASSSDSSDSVKASDSAKASSDGSAQPAAMAAKPAPAAKPDNSLKAQMKAAGQLVADGKIDEAIAAYEKIGVQKSKKAETWRLNCEGLAYLAAKEPDYKKAAAVFEKAVAADDSNGVAWNNLGTSYEQLDQVDKAKAAYQKGVDAGSDNAKANLDSLEARSPKKAPDETQANAGAASDSAKAASDGSAGESSAKAADSAAPAAASSDAAASK